MVLLDYKDKIKVQASFSFKADIWSYDGTIKTVKKTMQPFILTQQVSQCCAFFTESDTEISNFHLIWKQKLQQNKEKRGRSSDEVAHRDSLKQSSASKDRSSKIYKTKEDKLKDSGNEFLK